MRITFVILIFGLVLPVSGQSKKTVKKHDILSQTTYEADYEDSNGKEVIESEEIFDESGNLVEYKDYKQGKLNKWVKYEYNADNDLVKEVKLSADGNILKTEEYKYEDGLKVEKIEYDSKNRIINKRRYVYKFREQN